MPSRLQETLCFPGALGVFPALGLIEKAENPGWETRVEPSPLGNGDYAVGNVSCQVYISFTLMARIVFLHGECLVKDGE